jgi:hypothetical protein
LLGSEGEWAFAIHASQRPDGLIPKPSLQLQAELPGVESEFAPQASHSATVEPVVFWNVPASQEMQVLCLATILYLPASHQEQTDFGAQMQHMSGSIPAAMAIEHAPPPPPLPPSSLITTELK